MSSKVTAVEFLIDEIRNYIKVHGKLSAITLSKLKMQAKELEKQQIMDAHLAGGMNCQGGKDNFNGFQEDNHYYNETFNQK
jgi:hypothetical protein